MFSVVHNYLIPSPVIYVLNSVEIKNETNFSEEQRNDVSFEHTIARTYQLPEQTFQSAANVFDKSSSSKWSNTTYRSNAKWFRCVHCSKKYLHEKALKRHIFYTHTKEKTFTCDECGEKFAWQAYLNRHKKIHYPEFKCMECGRMCPSAKNLKNHMKSHVSTHGSKCDCGCRGEEIDEFRTYNCSRCNMQFQDHSSLARHRKIHTIEKCYVCDECRKRFAESYQLKEHKTNHPIVLSFECEECKRRFKTRSSLRYHQRVHNALFVCEECNRPFATQAHWESHRRVHSDSEKLCVCGQCNIGRINKRNKLFKSRDRGSRNGSIPPRVKLDKPYVCEICDRQFCHARNLNRHKNNAHYIVKRYVCEECDKLFTTLKYLNKHQRKFHI